MADSTSSKSYSSDPTLWLYTSLSSGSSQIVTATSRLETILKANRIPFKALDVATDEKARMLWGRRAGKRKLPGLVRMGMVIGDIDEIEEWNEYGELKEQVGDTPAAASATTTTTTTTIKPPTAASTTIEPIPAAPSFPTSETTKVAPKASTTQPPASKPASSISFAPEKPRNEQTGAGSGIGGAQASMSLTMRQLGQEAAARAKQNKSDALSARKAQMSAAEKPTDTSQLSKADSTIVATSTTAQQDKTSTTDSKPATTDKENIAPADTMDGTSDSKSYPLSSTENTASRIDAVGPESPLPTIDDPLAKSQNTAILGLQSAKSSESVISESSTPVSLGNIALPNTGYTTHRGSSISAASKEEIKEIEEANKIPEEPEAEEEDKPNIQTDNQNETAPVVTEGQISTSEEHEQSSAKVEEPISHSETVKADVDPPSTKDESISSTVTPNDQAEPKTQDQAVAEPKKATESVED